MSIFLTPNAENDFIQLNSTERQQVTRVLLRGTPLDIDKIAGVDGLHCIRVGELRLPAKRTANDWVILRILPKPDVDRFLAAYRGCNATRNVGTRVPLADSVIATYANGQTPVGMIESIEERTEVRVEDLRGEVDVLRNDIATVRESIQFLELCGAESRQTLQQKYNDLRNEFVLTLESIEERVVTLESPRSVSFASWLRARFVRFISFCRAGFASSAVPLPKGDAAEQSPAITQG